MRGTDEVVQQAPLGFLSPQQALHRPCFVRCMVARAGHGGRARFWNRGLPFSSWVTLIGPVKTTGQFVGLRFTLVVLHLLPGGRKYYYSVEHNLVILLSSNSETIKLRTEKRTTILTATTKRNNSCVIKSVCRQCSHSIRQIIHFRTTSPCI